MSARVVAWERADESSGHSLARLEQVAGGWRVHGHEVLVGEGTLTCWFHVDLDERWRTRSVVVESVSRLGVRRVELVADDARRWTVDGTHLPELDGALDVDVAATPLTNTFPIRRLHDLEVGGARTLVVAWVDVPDLHVHRVEQTYTRLPDADGLVRWRYGDPRHGSFLLSVDEDGLVVDYEGFARRVG